MAIHAGLVYLLMALGLPLITAPTAPSIDVTLIHRTKRPVWRIPRLEPRPKLAKLQILQWRKRFDFRMREPAELITRPNQPISGSPAPHGATVEPGGHVALTFARYVVPIYPASAARRHQHGLVTVLFSVVPAGTVAQVRIMRSTGAKQMDRAAVDAVRRWRFAPFKPVAAAQVWSVVTISFMPPGDLPGIPPFAIMPYTAVANLIDTQIEREEPRYAPRAAAGIRRVLGEVTAAFRHGRRSTGDSLEAELGPLGPVQDVRFMGFLPHGMEDADSDSDQRPHQPAIDRDQWEVYEVEQQFGLAVWLVKSAPSGAIRRIELTIRCKGPACTPPSSRGLLQHAHRRLQSTASIPIAR